MTGRPGLNTFNNSLWLLANFALNLLVHNRVRGCRSGLRSDPVDVLRQLPAGAAGLAPPPHPPPRPQPGQTARGGRRQRAGAAWLASAASAPGSLPGVALACATFLAAYGLILWRLGLEAGGPSAPAARRPQPRLEAGGPPELPVTRRAIVLAAGAGNPAQPDDQRTAQVPGAVRRAAPRRSAGGGAAGRRGRGESSSWSASRPTRSGATAGPCPRSASSTTPTSARPTVIYSLWLARAFLDRETFLFNCDIVFHPALLKRMLEGGMPNAVAVDSRGAPRRRGDETSASASRARSRPSARTSTRRAARRRACSWRGFDSAGARSVAAEVERLVAGRRKDVFPTSAYGP